MGEWIVLIALLLGSLFMLLAAVALVRMPDVFMRLQTNTKASTLGVALIFLAVIIHFDELHAGARSMAVIIFTLLTAPVAAHALGRACYLGGQAIWQKSVIDEMKGKYDPHTDALASTVFPKPDSDETPTSYGPPTS